MPDTVLPTQLVELAQKVILANRRAGRTVAVAESCTGGLVSAALTEIAGSSDVFEAGFVTYSNDMKAELLKVSHDVLDTFGAVSIATAWAMAQGRSIAEAAQDLGLTVETARNYSKKIYSKTGAGGQADLVRIIFTSVLAII